MDGICSAILNKIYALGAPGRYFVISSDEFFEAFPEDCARDEGQLKKALKALSADGYVDIKYSSGTMYCVALLKVFVEEKAPPPTTDYRESYGEHIAYQPQKNAYMYLFLAAFLGGTLGSAIICAIALIIGLC